MADMARVGFGGTGTVPDRGQVIAQRQPSLREVGFEFRARRRAARASSPWPARPSAIPSSYCASAHCGWVPASFRNASAAWLASPKAACDLPSSSKAIG